MSKDLKSFFVLISSALVLLFVLSSLFAYNYFDLSERLSTDEKSQLMIGGLVVFLLLMIILFLFASKFLFPILSLNSVVMAQKEGNSHHPFNSYYDDEIAAINDYIVSMKHELDKDTDTLDQLSLVDGLTGIKNRRYFFEFGEGIFKLAKRNNEDLAVIMFGIDHLNLINVKYGNKTGDNILKLLTEVTERYIRKSDILARYGGDEFAILLPQTSKDEANIVATKIQHTLETSDFKHRAETYFTISMGISAYNGDDIFLRDITQRADHALASAKESGRNRIEFN